MIALLSLPFESIRAAEAPPLVLEHLTPSDGMPQGTVYDTLQDSQGFVWLATEDGLVRYDGHDLHRYAYSRNARDGLPGNFIRQIVEDAHQDLWIAIKDAGLARWNRATDSFTLYRHDPKDPASLASDVTRAVLVDTRGRIWIGMGDAGIDVLDPASGRMEHFRHDAANPDSLSDDQILSLALDRSGSVWAGTGAGLDRWDPERRAFTHVQQQPGDSASLLNKKVYAVIQDRVGDHWVGTFDGGLDHLDASGRLIANFRHDPAHPESLASNDVRAILEDQGGRLWVGTPEGLDLMDRTTGHFSHYRHDDSDLGSLRDSYIMSLYQDPAGLLWIGTRGGGVSRWNPRSWELGGHRPEWLGGKFVTSFADAPNRKIWIASMGGGLVRFDDVDGETESIDNVVGRRDALGDQRVMALRLDRHDTLWIGTMAHGLKKLTPDGRLESIPVEAGDARSVSAQGVMTIFEGHDGRIWIGLHQGGANVLDPASGLIRQLSFAAQTPGALSAPSITAFAEDSQGGIWMGTDDGGLDLARPDGTVVKVFRHDPADPSSLPSNTVYALEVDGEGRVWVATDGGGLARVVGSSASPDSIRFDVMSREEGLSSDTLYGVVRDVEGRIWLSGNAGLMRLDPRSRAVKTYHREQGLEGEEFDYNAYHRLRDGRLCFGGAGWFNIFDPSRLSENAHAPHVALTNLEVLGVPVPTKTPYWLLDRITLDYRASIVSLDFGALDFISPKRNRLAYRVAGLSDRWIDLGTQHRVTLTNLDAGDHLLEVRAANADSVWSEPARLTIHRDPAPWRSHWAYALYAILLLLFIVHRVQLQRTKMRGIESAKQRLESQVAARTHELMESNRQLAEAAQAKAMFLARMSHELRTPMNGVVGMTELLSRTALSQAQARLTQTIRSSAQILLQIVNDLLDLSKIQAGKVEFESLPLDPLRLLEECTTLFSAAAEAKGIELIVCPPLPQASMLYGDSLRIRQIVLNLVGNAVKFTMQGEVLVKVDIDDSVSGNAMLEITVRDTGVGMDAATIQKIFEPFTQADESTTRRFGGTGLGLTICRELAELMGGSVTAQSRPNVGSTFHVRLPLKSAALPAALPVTDSSPPFTRRRVRILTRRPALAEALARHAAALGLETVCEEGLLREAGEMSPVGGMGDVSDVDGGEAGGSEAGGMGDRAPGAFAIQDLVIADISTHPGTVESLLRSQHAPRPPLVIVASTAQIDTLECKQLVDPDTVVANPVHREVLLSALRAACGQRPAAAPRPADRAAIGGHILLVEDEPVNAAVAQGYLAEIGCTSVWVGSGAEAIARSASERFDLIMMDLNMPAMDGFATARLIREREGSAPRVPIIALTAHEGKNYRESCLDAGMDDLMSKPYTLDQFAWLLRHWIKREPASIATAAEIDGATVAGLKNLRSVGEGDLYARLVELFQTASARAIAEIDAALGADDFEAAGAVCHKLASSAANVGALAFSRHVRRLEQLCEERDGARARRLFEAVRIAHPRLIEELALWKFRESA